MTGDEPRPIPRKVHIRSNDTPAVPTHDLHSNASPPLKTPTNISAIPRHTQRYLWVYPNRSEYRPRILHARSPTSRQQREAQNRDELKAHKEHTALPHPIGHPARRDGEEACTHVWRNGHELSVVGGVAHVFDNRREEEGEGVDRAEAGHADEHMDVYLPVAEGLPDVLHVEVIRQMAVIDLETVLDLCAFFVGEESRTTLGISTTIFPTQRPGRGRYSRLGVIVYAPVSNTTYHNTQQPFEDEDPRPRRLTTNPIHLRNPPRQDPPKRPGQRRRGEEHGHAKAAFVSCIPLRDVIIHTREQTAFKHAEDDSRRHQA
jgi:hypothetical protein